PGENHDQAGHEGQGQLAVELAFALLAALGAPRQKVDVRHQSKLLMARPAAIISAGASWASWPRMRAGALMPARGLATQHGRSSCSSAMSTRPSTEAQPPASTSCSTLLYSLLA